MEKDSFFDTNVIFSYSNYNDQSKEIIKKCYLYVSNKKGRFILCGAVLEELFEIIKKRARIHKEVISKIENRDYSFEDSILISKRDIPFAKQLYEKLKNLEPEKVSLELAKERDISKIAIENFLRNKIDEKVIPVEQIDKELIKKIHDIIPNHADCGILASALKLQKNRDLFLFVTADGQDLNPKAYYFLKEHFEINYKKEDYIFPQLKNLVFEI